MAGKALINRTLTTFDGLKVLLIKNKKITGSKVFHKKGI